MAKRTDRQFAVLRQICETISPHLVPKSARAYGADRQERKISSWIHVVLPLPPQLTHAIGLNDVCDSAARASKPSSNRSSRPSSAAISSVTTKTRSNGKSGGRSRSISCRVFWRGAVNGPTVSPVFSSSCAPCSGTDAICCFFSKPVGRQAACRNCSGGRRKPVCRDLHRCSPLTSQRCGTAHGRS